ALDAVDLCGREDGAEIGVLGEVLEVAAIAGVPCKVAPTSELDVEATRPGLPRDRLTSLPHHLRVEAGTERDERRVCSGTFIFRTVPWIGDAHARITRLNRRDAEPGNPRCVARAHVLQVGRKPRVAGTDRASRDVAQNGEIGRA